MAVRKRKPSRQQRERDLEIGNGHIRDDLEIYAMTRNGAFVWRAILGWLFLRRECGVVQMPEEIAKYLETCAFAINDHIVFSRKNQLQILADMGLRNPKGGSSLVKQVHNTTAALSKVERFNECRRLGMKPSEVERFLAPHFDTTPAALHQLVLKWKKRAKKTADKRR